MTVRDRAELLQALATNYLSEKNHNKVWQREISQGYAIALGKLQGACMALDLDFEDTESGVVIVTRISRKPVAKVESG